MGRVVLRLLAVVFALPLAGAADADYVSAKDSEVIVDAVKAKDEYCEGGLKGEVDREDRSVMEGQVGEENILLTVLKEAKSQDDLGTVAEEKLQGPVVGTAVAKVAFGFVLIFVWFCCSFFSCCPCFKCCRCGSGKVRNTMARTKIVVVVFCAVFGFLIVLVSGLGTTAFGKILDGLDNLACTSAKLLDGVLAGQTNPYFMGFVPLLETFEGMEESLGETAPFMTGLVDLIDSTATIEQSVALTSQTLLLLDRALDVPSEITDNVHRCKFCAELKAPLAATSLSLQSGVASSLASARTEVKGQLQGENAKVLVNTLRSAAEPIIEVKNILRDTLSIFVDTDKFMQLRGIVDGPVRQVVNLIIVLALVLLAFVVLTSVLWIMRPGSAEAPSIMVPRCAGCNWCCGFWFAILTFIIGGLMSVVGFSLSGVCLVMDDMSVALLKDISPSLGVNTTGESKQQLFDIVDACIVPADPNSNALLLDLVKTRDNASAPLVSLRQQIVDDVKSAVKSKFDDIDSKMAVNVSLETNPEMVNLMDILTNTAVDTMILFEDSDLFVNDKTYQPMASVKSLTEAAIGSSLACADATSSLVPGEVLKGIDTYMGNLSSLGTSTSDVAGTCIDDVTCPGSGPNKAPCEAGKKFLQLKTKIQQATFKCDVFADPVNNQACDPMNMASTVVNNKTSWTSTCQKADGTFTVKEVPCDFKTWVAHVRDFNVRIRKSLQRVDKTVDESGSTISSGMFALVEQYVFTPIDQIADGVTCGFMSRYYRQVVDGLCYQGAVGFSNLGTAYQWVGGISLVMTILTYAIWRRTVDNVNAAKKAGAAESTA